MAAGCRRVLMLSGYGFKTVAGLVSELGICSNVVRRWTPCSSSLLCGPNFYHGRSSHTQHVSDIILKSSGNQPFFVDTLKMVRKLEAADIPTKHAEAITSAITEVLNDSLENVAQSFLLQSELQKENLQYEIKRLRSDIEMFHSESRSEFDKEIREIRFLSAVEAAKYDVIKFSIGYIVFVAAVGFAVVYM